MSIPGGHHQIHPLVFLFPPNYGTGMYLSAYLTHCLHMLATLSMGIPTTPARTASCHGAACRT